jgi:integrase
LIAEILGHSNVQMSFRYTHMTDQRKRKTLAALAESPAQLRHKFVTNEKEQAVNLL